MHQTKKGNQWYFGTKAHVGVDSKTKLIHTALVSAGQRGGCDRTARLAARGGDAGCGVIRPIVGRRMSSTNVRRKRGTAPIAAIGT